MLYMLEFLADTSPSIIMLVYTECECEADSRQANLHSASKLPSISYLISVHIAQTHVSAARLNFAPARRLYIVDPTCRGSGTESDGSLIPVA